MKPGAKHIIGFFLTICAAVSFHNILHLSPMLSMMTGFSCLGILGYYLKRQQKHSSMYNHDVIEDVIPFDIFRKVSRAEGDTLLCFYGVVLCVGELGFIGYLALSSEVMHSPWSGFIGDYQQYHDHACRIDHESRDDRRPKIFGGDDGGSWRSLLSIEPSAGVTRMGQAKGKYTFFSHLK